MAWATALDLHFAIELDGLAALYSLLATGIGFAVMIYSSRYIPLHLEHEGRPESEASSFYFFMLLFMGSMVGLAMAPGTFLVDVDWERGVFLIHILDASDPDAVRHHQEDFYQRYQRNVFP